MAMKQVSFGYAKSLIKPFYLVEYRGCPLHPIATMLQVRLIQNWFGLSDQAMEEALCKVTSMCFSNLLMERIPDENTTLNSRRLLEANDLAPEILRCVNGYLSSKGLPFRWGSIIEATVIVAPSLTRNADSGRELEMQRNKKAAQRHFGMKAHIGARTIVVAKLANEAGLKVVDEVLHRKEEVVYAQAGYTGADKRRTRKMLRRDTAQRPGRIQVTSRSLVEAVG